MKNFFTSLGIFTIILISYFIFSRFKSVSEIPEFKYKSLNNEIFTKSNINKSDKNIIFLYFSCKWGDCKDLINNIDNYKKIQNKNQFILVTTEKDINIIKDFVDYKNLNKLKIPILIDIENNFPTDFALGISIKLTKILVLDKNEKLLKNIDSFDELELL